MKHNEIELTILVKGRPITEYGHRGQVFVEGRANSEYEIEIRNNTYGRVEAVLSVDGLSVIDGKAAGQTSSGYMIEARSSIRVPGWILDNSNIAKFAFTGKHASYSTQMSGGDARNNGVIGVMVFKEKYTTPQYSYLPIVTRYNMMPINLNYNTRSYNINDDGHFGIATSESYTSGSIGTTGASGPASDMLWNASRGINSSKAIYGSEATLSASAQATPFSGMMQNSVNTSNSGEWLKSPGVSTHIVDESRVENTLGTAFGEAAHFATTTVEFKRGDLLSMMVLFYDDIRGLKARGVVMERIKKGKYKSQPDAFPANAPTGCVPPPGWKG